MEVLDEEPALDQEKVSVLGRYLDRNSGERERERQRERQELVPAGL